MTLPCSSKGILNAAALAVLLLPEAAPAAPPDDAVPFFCSATAAIGTEALLECRRSDSRELISTVPSGMLLFVTDVMTNPASTAVEGVFMATFGRDLADSDLPGTPSLDLIGHPVQALNFTTPYLVLSPDEILSVANFAESDFDIEVRASGYLAQTFVQPSAEVILLDGFEDPTEAK